LDTVLNIAIQSMREEEWLHCQETTRMATPVICDVGHEAWRAKEAKASDSEAPQWDLLLIEE
jgi:hypothetical protein